MKKILSVLLVIMIITMTACAGAFNPMDETKDVQLWSGDLDLGGCVVSEITDAEEDGYLVQFSVNEPFKGIIMAVRTWDVFPDASFSLYKFDYDVKTTLNTKPIKTERFTEIQNTQEFSFDEKPAGEYLLRIHDVNGRLGIWSSHNLRQNGVRAIFAGNALENGVYGYIRFCDDTYENEQEYFGKLTEYRISGGSHTPPPEYQYPNDSAVSTMNVNPSSWSAVDGPGRTLSTSEAVGKTKENKFVGCFYWIWHERFSEFNGLNVENTVSMYPEATNDYNHAAWENTVNTTQFFWNDPLFGNYRTSDEYVLRKHAEMLADAGVDVIIFDASNAAEVWKNGYDKLFQVFEKAKSDGVKVPQIAFLLNFSGGSDCRSQLHQLYFDIYYRQRYQDLWFYWQGKPLILAQKKCLDLRDDLDVNISNFFTFKTDDPSYFSKDTDYNDNVWGWCSDYPQTKYGIKDGKPEMMTVSVAQNIHDGRLVAMNCAQGAQGRSFTHGDYSYSYEYAGKTVTVNSEIENSKYYGLNFQQQWDYVHECDPEFVFITGFNEWIAGRFENWEGTSNAFPDQFRDEYSRDIEPSKGELKDYYYYQMIENIRRFKGCESAKKAFETNTVDILGDASQWDNIGIEYNHYTGSTLARDSAGYKDCYYKSDTMRNDIVSSKVAFDDNKVYFMVKTAEELSPYTDNAWMRLLIDTDFSGTSPNWEGFEYIVNRVSPSSELATLERSKGGWNFETVGQIRYSVKNNVMQLEIPREMLGMKKGGNLPDFNFKWSDNMQTDGDIMDFYLSGDVAPGGRFTFAFSSNIVGDEDLVDVDNDGEVTVNDALLALQLTVGKIQLSDRQIKDGDADRTQGLSVSDTLLILKKTVGKSEEISKQQ